MDIVKIVKDKLEQKIKELEGLKKRLPRKCGETVYNIPLELALKIEELEEEIEKLEKELKMAKCNICERQEDLIKVKDEEGNIVYVCENCYESVCEGYEKIEETEGGD